MWPFTRKRKPAKDAPPPLKPIITDRDLLDLRHHNTELRVWLPEEGKQALDAIAERLDVVRSAYLREFYVIYLYGLHELLLMQSEQYGLYYDPPPPPPSPEPSTPSESRPLFSRGRAEERIPGLGKNIVPLKLYLAQRIKDDLQALADKSGITLSQFVREILVSHFFGRTVWPDRLRNWSEEQERIASEWEQGVREPETIYPAFNDTLEDLEDNIVIQA